MKKISITDSEKKLLFIVLAIGILAAAYFFGFTKLNEQAAVIEASNVQDEATKTQLEGMVARQAETERETEGFKQGIKDVIAKYPSLIPQEKGIYLVQQAQDIVNFDVSAINFKLRNHAQSFSGENAPAGKYDLLVVTFNSNYDQFKELLKYIAAFPDRSTLPAINVAYDEMSGNLKGNINYKMFYLENSGKAYEEFPPTEIPSGKAGIFYPGDWYPLKDLEDALEEAAELQEQ
ncbi:MAG: hypothetical protein K6F51_07475 [Acetatifactor sp.]|nr:hypothetical protein [Acetatifactor sp.]